MRILVTAASRHGATAELARSIGHVLEQSGAVVAVLEPERVTSVAPYDGVVIGSAVYAGRWLPAARELVARESAALATKPTWLFSSGPIGEPAKPSTPPAEPLELTRTISAIDHQLFEGKLDRAQLGFAEKAIVSVVGAASGDYRPWEAVVAWARGIAAELSRRGTTSEAPATPVAAAAS
jgi:menaquinone-dependent protoporphyrinogen oxidase